MKKTGEWGHWNLIDHSFVPIPLSIRLGKREVIPCSRDSGAHVFGYAPSPPFTETPPPVEPESEDFADTEF
jgi:hypothetical protein